MGKLKTFFIRVRRKSISWLVYLFSPSDERISYNTNSIFAGHSSVTYRGVAYIKCPFDYVLYQMILMEVKPGLGYRDRHQ